MHQMTNEARAEGARSLCLARRNKVYPQIIDIKVPTCWQQLSNKQLRFVFKLLNGNLRSANSLRHVFDKYICRRSSDLTVNFSLPQVKALCLLKFASSESKEQSSWLCRVVSKFCGAKWAKMKILRRKGSIFIFEYQSKDFLLFRSAHFFPSKTFIKVISKQGNLPSP